MGTYIASERRDAVALVTIDNPPMNALSSALLDELEAEIDALDSDDGVRAIVLRGAGERAFVAGADIKEFPSLRETASEGGSARGIQRVGHRMDAARTPFVAAIQGFCLGGGLELAMCCDIRVCADDARLGQPEIKLGLIPGGGGTQRLPRLIGAGRAMLLNLTGEFVDAQTAHAWGLVEKVVPVAELEGTALEVAGQIAAQSPHAVAVLRELARTTRDLPLEEGLRREADAFVRCLRSEDGAEGVAAFIEKRAPSLLWAVESSMRAIVLDESLELELRDVPEPEPGEGQVLVRVRAAGINYADVLIREGRYPQPPPLPYVPGSEIAGETADGRRVIGFVRSEGGGYAEQAVCDEDWLFDLPDGAPFEEGAAFLLAFLTAWIPLTRQARVGPGTRVLVTAAAGGVGSAGVRVARALGADVVGAVGSPEKLEHVLSLGAGNAVTYDALSEVEPVDVILDQVGGELFSAGLKLLRPLGTIVGIGFAGGAWQPLDPALLVGRNVSVSGFYLGRFMKLQPEVVRGAASELLERWSAGAIAPVVGATYPLEEAADALRLVAERRSTGKVVLVP